MFRTASRFKIYQNQPRYLSDQAVTNVVTNDANLKLEYDAVIIGGGHNGLVAAAYLQRAGIKACVLERRHVVGGAAVTEEIIPGFKFSRASYLLSLLRPKVLDDLQLKKHGLHFYLRDPNSYTPLREPKNGATSLTLGSSEAQNRFQISQFSMNDAENFVKYEKLLERIVDAIDPLLDTPPAKLLDWSNKSLREKIDILAASKPLLKTMGKIGTDASAFYELMTAPANKILQKWFESEPLKATLATDSVIGAMISPEMPGSGYVLLHHMMGSLDGVKGAWGYVKGGMGEVSQSIARSARAAGADIFVNKHVRNILVSSENKVKGVALKDGSEIRAKCVLSNATCKVTFEDLLEPDLLPSSFLKDIKSIDHTSPVTKINVAVSCLPNFSADPSPDNVPGPQHRGTIHLNSEDCSYIHNAYLDALRGKPSERPIIEMTIPSSVDSTISPPGAHVVQLFTQYTPYLLADGSSWDEKSKLKYANKVFDIIEEYAPGFRKSIIGWDILTPADLEEIFGLTGGNIFHGAMSLDQLFFNRPLPGYCDHRSPIQGLYICGSSTHPGGGVMGSSGRLAANAAIEDNK